MPDQTLQQQLFAAAKQAYDNAYAPYSHYQVGAALLTSSGQVFAGCNVENASYPAGICAERAAVANAVSAGHRQFTTLALVTVNAGTPCGICRQVLHEFNPDMIVHIYKADGTHAAQLTLRDLLPAAFGAEELPAPLQD